MELQETERKACDCKCRQTESKPYSRDVYRYLKCFGLFILIVATIGFIYQITCITIDYVKRDVVTEMKIERPNNFTLPDISFCAPLTHVVNFDKLADEHPQVVQDLQKQFPTMKTFEDYMLIKENFDTSNTLLYGLVKSLNLEQLSKVLYPHEVLFDSVNLVNTDTHFGVFTESEFNDRCKWKTYFNEDKYCYCLSCAEKKPFELKFLDTFLAETKGQIAEIFLDTGTFWLIGYLEVRMHRNNEYPRGILSPVITIRAHKDQPFIKKFSYKRFATYRLPPPFATNCRDYAKEGFASRLAKMEECENELMRQLYGTPLYGNTHFVEPNTFHAFKYFYENYNDTRSRENIVDLVEECGDLAKEPNCVDEYFVPTDTAERKVENTRTRLILMQPSEPAIIHRDSEKLSFTQYLILIQSLSNTYFGVTMAFTAPQFVKWILFKKLKQWKQWFNRRSNDEPKDGDVTTRLNACE